MAKKRADHRGLIRALGLLSAEMAGVLKGSDPRTPNCGRWLCQDTSGRAIAMVDRTLRRTPTRNHEGEVPHLLVSLHDIF